MSKRVSDGSTSYLLNKDVMVQLAEAKRLVEAAIQTHRDDSMAGAEPAAEVQPKQGGPMKTLLAVLVALSLFAVVACDNNAPLAQSVTPKPAARVMSDGIANQPVSEVMAQIAPYGQAGLVALSIDGQVWAYSPTDNYWYKIPDNRPVQAQFISVTGTPNGQIFAGDINGDIWRYFGGWVPFPSPNTAP